MMEKNLMDGKNNQIN